MTSGNFSTISIDSITIRRGDRQRRELEGLEELAASINAVGLINPIVVDDNLELVAGERRLTACRDYLGWTAIPVQFSRDCSPDQLYLIELEENVKRVDLNWQDQCRAVAEYHSLRAKQDPAWTANKTAKALGVKDAEVSERRAVAEALEAGDPLVTSADKYSVARGIVQRKRARKADEAGAAMASMLQVAPEFTPLEDADAGMEFLDITEAPKVAPIPFLHADFHEWARTYTGPKYNFLHCDFPYGVNAQSHAQGAGQAFGTYDDREEVYWQLLSTLNLAMENVVAESAHLMFWFSMEFYQPTYEALTDMGWMVNRFPLIWFKSDNSGILPDPKRGPRRVYETAFLCHLGDRPVVQPVANTFAAPNPKSIHMSEKNPDMLRHFFRMFVDESTRMLDPTMGSGQAVRVAEAMGAHHALGLERDLQFYETARDAYISALTTSE